MDDGVTMAKSDEIFALARAAIERDHARVVSSVRCIMAGEADRSTFCLCSAMDDHWTGEENGVFGKTGGI